MPNTMSLRGHTSRPNAVSARGRALRAIPAQSLVPARRFQQNVGRSVAAASGASIAPAPVDDKNVPEAHRGLHGFLYGEGGAEEHDAVGSYAVRKDEDEGGMVMPVSAYLESRDGDKPLGTYLVYDSEGRPQYVGYSRNMVLAIKGHLARVGPQRCASVRAMVFANKAMASRTNMERGVEAWVEELLGGVLPPGNADPAQRIEWEGGAAAASVEEEAAGGGGNGGRGVVGVGPSTLGTEHMSAAELAAYEEKRLKMRKAMGEKVALPPGVGADDAHGHSHSHDHEEEDSPEERRRKLMKAMDRGDWSAVVSQQTQEATGAGEGAAASSSSSSAAPHPPAMSSASGGSVDGSTSIDMEEPAPLRTIDSPFRAGGQGDAHVGSLSTVASVRSMDDMLRLTVRGVEACLDEVRPYLMADGGDVEVVDVQDGIVYLRLQGACSSCPSQTSTMKGGIERIIRATFGDQVRDILQLEATDPGANPQRVDAALNMLRGAIHNWGGAVEVVSVENHVAVLRYKGPPAIGKGVQGAIKEQFKELREVQLVPFEEEGAAAGDSKAGAQGKAGSA